MYADSFGNNQLHIAATTGNLVEISELQKVVHPSALAHLLFSKNKDDCMPIHLAAASGNSTVVKRLAAMHQQANEDAFYDFAIAPTKTPKQFSLILLCLSYSKEHRAVESFASVRHIVAKQRTASAEATCVCSSSYAAATTASYPSDAGSSSSSSVPPSPTVELSDDNVSVNMLSYVIENFCHSHSLARRISDYLTAFPDTPLSVSAWIPNRPVSSLVVAVRHEKPRSLIRLLQYTAALCPMLASFELNIEFMSMSRLDSRPKPAGQEERRRAMANVVSQCNQSSLPVFHRMFSTFMLSLPDTDGLSAVESCMIAFRPLGPIATCFHRLGGVSRAVIERCFALNHAPQFETFMLDGVDFLAGCGRRTLVDVVADLLGTAFSKLTPTELAKSSTVLFVSQWITFLYRLFVYTSGARSFLSEIALSDSAGRRYRGFLQQMVLIQQLSREELSGSSVTEKETESLSLRRRCLSRTVFEHWLRSRLGLSFEEQALHAFFHVDADALSQLKPFSSGASSSDPDLLEGSVADAAHVIRTVTSRRRESRESLMKLQGEFASSAVAGSVDRVGLQKFVCEYAMVSKFTLPRYAPICYRAVILLRLVEKRIRTLAPCSPHVAISSSLEHYFEWASVGKCVGGVFDAVSSKILASDIRQCRLLGQPSVYGNTMAAELSTSFFGTFQVVIKLSQARQQPAVAQTSATESLFRLASRVSFPGFPLSMMHDYIIGKAINLVHDYAPCFVYTYGMFASSILSNRDLRSSRASVDLCSHVASLLESSNDTCLADYLLYEPISDFEHPTWLQQCSSDSAIPAARGTLYDYLELVRVFCASTFGRVSSDAADTALSSIEYDLCSVVVQIVNTLSVLNQWCDFVHFDLKHDNVLFANSSDRYSKETPFLPLVGCQAFPSMGAVLESSRPIGDLHASANVLHRCGTIAPVIIDFGMSHVALSDDFGGKFSVGIEHMPLSEGVACQNLPGQDLFYLLSILYRFTAEPVRSRLQWLFVPFEPMLSLRRWFKMPLDNPDFVPALRTTPRLYLDYMQRACPSHLKSAGLFIQRDSATMSATPADMSE